MLKRVLEILTSPPPLNPPSPPPPLPESFSMAPTPGTVAVVIVVVTTAALLFFYRERLKSSHTLDKWREAESTISKMMKKIDISGEFDLPSYKMPMAVNLALLSETQNTVDPRQEAATAISSSNRGDQLTARLSAGAHYMRFASAAYGGALMLAFGLIPPPTVDQLKLPEREKEIECVCKHTGVSEADLVTLETLSLDITGDAECLRHIVVVDHSTQAVVLALRGTASISDAIHDLVAHAEPFCGGLAHAGMAAMAKAVWRSAGASVLSALIANRGYDLIITGHSLGAGTAGLLTILLNYLQFVQSNSPAEVYNEKKCFEFQLLEDPPPQGVKIRGFCFAPPPVFAMGKPGVGPPDGGLSKISAFVYGGDCVPFLSIHAGRRLFAALHGIDSWSRDIDRNALFQTLRGNRPPPRDLALRAANGVAGISDNATAPKLLIPAHTFLWMRPAGKGENDTKGNETFDVLECDPVRVVGAVVGGVPLGFSMITDHMTDGYEKSLCALRNASDGDGRSVE